MNEMKLHALDPDTEFEIRALAVWGRARYLWGSPQYWIFTSERGRDISKARVGLKLATFRAGSFNRFTRDPSIWY